MNDIPFSDYDEERHYERGPEPINPQSINVLRFTKHDLPENQLKTLKELFDRLANDGHSIDDILSGLSEALTFDSIGHAEAIDYLVDRLVTEAKEKDLDKDRYSPLNTAAVNIGRYHKVFPDTFDKLIGGFAKWVNPRIGDSPFLSFQSFMRLYVGAKSDPLLCVSLANNPSLPGSLADKLWDNFPVVTYHLDYTTEKVNVRRLLCERGTLSMEKTKAVLIDRRIPARLRMELLRQTEHLSKEEIEPFLKSDEEALVIGAIYALELGHQYFSPLYQSNPDTDASHYIWKNFGNHVEDDKGLKARITLFEQDEGMEWVWPAA